MTGQCRWMAVLGVAFLMAGCERAEQEFIVRHDPEASFENLKTYRWMPDNGRPTEAWQEIETETKQHIVKAVDRVLAAKGYVRTDAAQADLLLGCHVGLDRRLDARAMNAYYEYPPGWGWNYYRHTRDLDPLDQRDPRVYLYNRGSIVVDVVRGSDRNLVWRGAANARLTPGTAASKDQEWFDKGADLIFSDFPPR